MTMVKITTLLGAAEFCVFIATAQGPCAATRTVVVFEDCDLVARLDQFMCGDQSRNTCPENEDGLTFTTSI
jgi:hypothetical protein